MSSTRPNLAAIARLLLLLHGLTCALCVRVCTCVCVLTNLNRNGCPHPFTQRRGTSAIHFPIFWLSSFIFLSFISFVLPALAHTHLITLPNVHASYQNSPHAALRVFMYVRVKRRQVTFSRKRVKQMWSWWLRSHVSASVV